MLGIKHATTTNVAQSGFPQSSAFREDLSDSSEFHVHKVLAHVRAQLNGSDRGAFHKAVYPRVIAEKTRSVCNNAQYLQMCIYIDNTVCSTLILDDTQNM